MSRAEKFISERTMNGSNQLYRDFIGGFDETIYQPWLTPDQAKRAVEIAREETTDKIKRLLKENYLVKSTEPLRWVSWEKVFNNIKQAMKDE